MDDGLKNKAYLLASRLKNEGYDNEVILARLDKQGIPEELIKQVIKNLAVQEVIDTNAAKKPFNNIALIKISVGVFLAIASMIALPGQIILPIGLIGSGIVYALLTKPK